MQAEDCYVIGHYTISYENIYRVYILLNTKTLLYLELIKCKSTKFYYFILW